MAGSKSPEKHLMEDIKDSFDSIDKEKLKRKFEMNHFSVNSVIRGMQLTLVGAHRALQNPNLFTSEHYRQAAFAVVVGLAIRLAISIPIVLVRASLWVLSIFVSLDNVTWDDSLIEGLDFIAEYVLQVPFFLMALLRYIVPTLDNLFMQSLQWVDLTYSKKHEQDDPHKLRALYYPNLATYSAGRKSSSSDTGLKSAYSFIYRFGRKGLLSLSIFLLSYMPLVGQFVLPAASFYTFHKAAGLGPATLIFGAGLFAPKRYLVIFLQTYFSSRSLMRELLVPYFHRVHFTKQEKKNWFRCREGVLFGFGLGFYILVRIPLVGVLIYGIAEASTAYLITKITDPPPVPEQARQYAVSQQVWRNEHEFLNLSLANLDAINHRSRASEQVDH